jgi:hypothetical protein
MRVGYVPLPFFYISPSMPQSMEECWAALDYRLRRTVQRDPAIVRRQNLLDRLRLDLRDTSAHQGLAFQKVTFTQCGLGLAEFAGPR